MLWSLSRILQYEGLWDVRCGTREGDELYTYDLLHFLAARQPHYDGIKVDVKLLRVTCFLAHENFYFGNYLETFVRNFRFGPRDVLNNDECSRWMKTYANGSMETPAHWSKVCSGYRFWCTISWNSYNTVFRNVITYPVNPTSSGEAYTYGNHYMLHIHPYAMYSWLYL